MAKKSEKKILLPRSKWMIGALAVLALLVLAQFWGNLRMTRSVALMASANSRMIDDVGQTKQFVTDFGADLNEVRRLLLMPTKDYHFDSFLDGEEVIKEEPEDPMTLVFKTIERLGLEEEIKARTERNKNDLDAYMNAQETLAYLKNKGFYLRSGLTYQIVNEDGETRLFADLTETGQLRLTPQSGIPITFSDADGFEKFKEAFMAVVEKTPPKEDDPFVNEADLANPFQEKIDALRTQIEALKDDEGFQATVRKAHLQFVFEARETDRAIEYDILTPQGVPLQILYISKETGELMMRDPDADVGSLLNSVAITEHDILVLPTVLNLDSRADERVNEVNLLIAGKHGMNVDTIMLANIDTKHRKVTLVSIPRDLYYNGRKINSVYADYGMDEMRRQLGDITGLTISHYLLVDMYVFADLVDLVGGVTVTLEEDLIDPTYKIKENGKASTLYYPAGEHRLNGKEALRIARSRYTTSDYSRAKRQQIILDGLLHKARALGFGDAPTVLKLIKTVLQKTETDLSLDEAARYYFRYQDYDLDRGNVLSSGNVLDSVPVPVSGIETSLKVDVCHMDEGGQEVCEKKSAVYTLQPRDNNWDYVKWYIREILKD